MEIFCRVIGTCLPFEWARYQFMQNALLAVLIVAPLFALLGTAVVHHRMVFFSDVIGHSALTGIAVGMLVGLADPTPAMILLAVLLALAMNFFKSRTGASSDTVMGVFFACVVAVGVMLLSRGGGFAKYTGYLIGDILSVTPAQIAGLLGIFLAVLGFWYFGANALFLIGINRSLARSRGISPFWIEAAFAVILAVVVTVSIRLVGILIINSFLILPAAAARNLSGSVRAYTFWAVGLSLAAAVAGLILSYYWGTASGATIVVILAVFYGVSAFFGRK